jgi:hypothetical protein
MMSPKLMQKLMPPDCVVPASDGTPEDDKAVVVVARHAMELAVVRDDGVLDVHDDAEGEQGSHPSQHNGLKNCLKTGWFSQNPEKPVGTGFTSFSKIGRSNLNFSNI